MRFPATALFTFLTIGYNDPRIRFIPQNGNRKTASGRQPWLGSERLRVWPKLQFSSAIALVWLARRLRNTLTEALMQDRGALVAKALKARSTRLLQLGLSALLAGWATVSVAAGIPTVGVRHLFDITGQGAGGLSLPTDVAVSSDGRIYVVDGGNHRIVAFDRSGKYLLTIGRKGSGEGQFKDPVGVGTDGRGRIYVADTGNHRIQVFGADGRFQYAFPVVDGGLAIRPIDVATDTAGTKIYVTGNNNHKIMEFAAPGKLVRQWGGHGESGGLFRYPASVVVSAEGDVYVADALNSRVQGFDEEGALLIQVGTWGVLPGQLFRPKGVAIDGKQRIYISDSYMDVIQVYDSEGRFLHVLGQNGAPQRFVSAGGIAMGRDNRLYAAEILRNKVSVYSLGD